MLVFTVYLWRDECSTDRPTDSHTGRQADRVCEMLLLLFIISSGNFNNRLSVTRGGINLCLTIAGKTNTQTLTLTHTECYISPVCICVLVITVQTGVSKMDSHKEDLL